MDIGNRVSLNNKFVVSDIVSKKRPKLLFLAYPFPPATVVAAVRTWNIAKYLSGLGWDITVVTPDPTILRNAENGGRISPELERYGIKRILTDHRWRCLAPNHLKCWNQNLAWFAGAICRTIARHLQIDSRIGWIKEAERVCSHLSQKDVDIILASGSPFVTFRLARNLSKRLCRPYVLDYRDPWTANPHHGRAPHPAIIREEASLLHGCAAVTVVSPTWGTDLTRRYGVGAKLHVVTNGYDSREMEAVKPYDFGHCAIVYTGIFYPPRRVISPFLAALKDLKESLNETSNEWYFHYYGAQEDHVREEAGRFDLADRIVLHGNVPRHEALSAVKGASLAVVVVSIEEHASYEMLGMVPAKIYEAVGLGTPVLLIAPSGSDAAVLIKSTGLVRSFRGVDIQNMVSFLKDVVCGRAPQSRSTETYSWATISQDLDAILRGCITSNDLDMRGGDGSQDGTNES